MVSSSPSVSVVERRRGVTMDQTCPNCGLEHDEGGCEYDLPDYDLGDYWTPPPPPHCENCALEERLSGGERPKECHGSHVR